MLLALLIAGQTAYAQLDLTDMAADLEEAFTFTKYPNYFQYDTMMHRMAAEYPEICTIDTFGYSNKGRLLLALKISDNAADEELEPRFLYTSSIHGDELSGYMHMLRLANFLLEEYEVSSEVTSLVNDVEIWINPLFNPDGAYGSDNMTLNSATRYNSKGSDLNRNFPEATRGELDDTTGRQTETKYMMEFMRKYKFNLSANIHSGAEVVNYPWDNGPNHRVYNIYEKHPDDDWLYFISREYADEARAIDPTFMSSFTDGVTNGCDWYRIEGGRQDYATFYLEGRELTLELSIAKDEASESLEGLWNINKWSLFNLISQARYGIHGTVVCAETSDPIEARITVMNYDSSFIRVETSPGIFNWHRTDTLERWKYPGAEELGTWITSDAETGTFYRYLKEGSYDLIISAEGFHNDTIHGISVIDYQATDLLVEMDSIGTDVRSRAIDPGVMLYPNPASNFVTVELEDPGMAISSIQIYSLEGKLISLVDGVSRSTIGFDVGHFESGLYLLRIRSDDRTYHRTMLIAH